jgi:hypothetical protein
MKIDLAAPAPPPESGEDVVGYLLRLKESYRSVPRPPAGETDVRVYYTQVIVPWDEKRVRYLMNKRNERKASRKPSQRQRSKTHHDDGVSGGLRRQPERQDERQPQRQTENDVPSDRSDAPPDNVRDLPFQPRLTRSQEIARERDRLLAMTRYVPYRRDCTQAELLTWAEKNTKPDWEEPGFVGTCPTWVHASGWMNGVVDPDWRKRRSSKPGAETRAETPPKTAAETPDPGGGMVPPVTQGGTNPTHHPVGLRPDVSAASVGSAEVSPPPTNEKPETSSNPTEPHEPSPPEASSQDRLAGVVSLSNRRPRGDISETTRRQLGDNEKMIEIVTALHDRLRLGVERRLDEQNRRLDEQEAVIRHALTGIASVLSIDLRSSLGDAVLRFLDGTTGEAAGTSDGQSPDGNVEPDERVRPSDGREERPEPLDAWSEDGRMIRKAWENAVGDNCSSTSGEEWTALRELYALARGLASCEDEALTLLMYWAEKYKAENADDKMAVYRPQRLLLRPAACPPRLPEDRSAPEKWTSRERVKLVWRARLEAERETDARARARAEAPAFDEEAPPADPSWDAGLEEEPSDDGEQGAR